MIHLQLVFDFSVQILIPAYRMTWREGEAIHVIEVAAHTVLLDV